MTLNIDMVRRLRYSSRKMKVELIYLNRLTLKDH